MTETIGSYQIVAKLGQGGMGEVYRAHDTRLNRDVALKILPEAFGSDPDRLARFRREAQVLASLNHPNIATIYGLEHDQAGAGAGAGAGSGLPAGEPRSALVMELVEGEDLSAIIARGPMPLAEALPVARQIADALEAAHDAGVVHRDLKPANIKVRADGTVKVLDFGLAKAMDPAGGSGADALNSPTLTARATQMGMVLGTAAYMAPEQARGKAVDRRADIWAFGAVLYEMLTGRRAFEGEDISVTLAGVIKDDVRWEALPPDLPRPLRRLLRRCLEKDPRRRLSAIGDARLEMEEPAEPDATSRPGAEDRNASSQSSRLARLWPALAGIVVTAAVAALLWPRGPDSLAQGTIRLSVLPPPASEMYPDSTGVAISPDGTMVAFIVGSVTRSDSELWVRPLASKAATRLDDATGAVLPFWSPDNRRIGFFTNTKLKTIAATGGRAETLADAPGGRGAIWLSSNDIVYAPDATGPLYRVNATGGTPVAVTTVDTESTEAGHRFPTLLPDGRHFLYATVPGRNGKFNIYAASADGGPRVLVGAFESAPVYADPGWLLYARQGVLAARPFDARTLTVSGDPVALEDEPTSITDPAISFTAGQSVSTSRTGALAYYAAPSTDTTAAWYDTSGRPVATLDLPPGHYEQCAISPDGARAVCARSVSPSESSLWLIDLGRASAVPLTTAPGRNDSPVWSPDGRQIAFAADREGPQHIYVKHVDEASPERQIDDSSALFKSPNAWTSDGRSILVTQLDADTAQNIYRVSLDNGEAVRLVAGPTIDRSAALSPDGRWLAYSSDQTGRFEVYVQAVSGAGRRVQVSQQSGVAPAWTSDGRALVFVGADQRSVWRADVTVGTAFAVGLPRQTGMLPPGVSSFDFTPDRQRLLTLAPTSSGVGSATVVLNWRAALDAGR